MSFVVVIPARYASTRLPGKPLLDICGKPMVQWVYERACQSAASRVVVATDDQRIVDAAVGFGAEVCLTAAGHESGTDRIEETARQLGLGEDQCVVNVQGDEPLIPPGIIDQVAVNLARRPDAGIATLSVPVATAAAFVDPNVVKVVTDREGFALYFSRAPIPWPRDAMAAGGKPVLPEHFAAQRHVGIYAYRVAFLRSFVSWPVSSLEATEKLEQLRAMAHGVRIHVEQARAAPPAGVDTAADLEVVRQALERGA